MTTRTARCACCDFCQKRSGNVFIASAQFAEDHVVLITGETRNYNGLEVDGVGAVDEPGGINYHFCTTCGSSVFFRWVAPHTRRL
jgi:hypothetical protein